MAFQPAARPDIPNQQKKILEELNLRKQLLKSGTAQTLNPSALNSPIGVSINSNTGSENQSNFARAAHANNILQHANSTSFGYFISQESSFGLMKLNNLFIMACMKLKVLEQHLQEIKTFTNPKIKLEQYATMPHICARMLHSIQSCYDDIEGKIIADLGCGCGSLSIGSLLLNAQMCVGFDIDDDALDICRENCSNFDFENIDLVKCDVINSFPLLYKKFDTVIMNPPFGTKTKGIDVEFLKLSLQLSDNAVYSLHKTSTRNYILTKAQSWGVKAEVLAELNFDLPATYKFHKKTRVDIQVDFIRFSH